MTTIEPLQQTAANLARKLERAGEPDLRRVAAAIARAAVERAGVSHPAITEAMAHLAVSSSAHPQLRERVRTVAGQLDADYFAVKQRYEEREDAGKSEPEVIAAFARARAASTVAAALENDARTAAAEAAYEAIAATDDPKYFTDVADRVLAK